MNNFDIIYIINLKHRTDRLQSVMSELKKMDVPDEKIKRIEAIHNKERGYLGCAQSHRLALSLFLRDNNHKNCLILEDDFVFCKDKEYINNVLNKTFEKLKNNFDVLMLSSNIVACEYEEGDIIAKIHDAQTTSSYCVSKDFAPKLIECFKESENGMNKFFNIYPEKLLKHYYAIDMNWKKLQPDSRWYCIYPCIGKQKDDYSDIEKRFVRYNC